MLDNDSICSHCINAADTRHSDDQQAKWCYRHPLKGHRIVGVNHQVTAHRTPNAVAGVFQYQIALDFPCHLWLPRLRRVCVRKRPALGPLHLRLYPSSIFRLELIFFRRQYLIKGAELSIFSWLSERVTTMYVVGGVAVFSAIGQAEKRVLVICTIPPETILVVGETSEHSTPADEVDRPHVVKRVK